MEEPERKGVWGAGPRWVAAENSIVLRPAQVACPHLVQLLAGRDRGQAWALPTVRS